MEQIYTPKQDYKVLVRCFTYNQSKYIEDALNGFAMQQTNFPFVCLVMDDCSTDGEQESLKVWVERECDMEKAEYIEIELSNIVLVPHKSNLNCVFAIYLLKQNLYGEGEKKMCLVSPWREHCEYEAMCEGDDYWIDDSKLQIQVDFLDSRREFSVCSHRIERLDQETKQIFIDNYEKYFQNKNGVVFNNNMPVWLAETCSVLFRTKILLEVMNIPGPKRDVVQMYYNLKKGNGMCINKVMGVYRQNQGGVFAKQSVQKKYIDGTYKAIKALYELEKTNDAKILYYRSYSHTFLKSHGRIVLMERFDIFKFLYVFVYMLSLILTPHPAFIKK